MKAISKPISVITCLSVGAAFLAAGCSSTNQTRGEAKPSAFLGNIAQLREGKEGEAKLIYINPKTNFRNYNKILFDPVVLVAENAKSSIFSEMPKEDRQAVVDYVDATIREKLAKSYTFVTEPGPGVMRLRVAITESRGSSVVLDTVSSVIPIGLAISVVKRVAVGTHTAVGLAGAEMEIKDTVSGERLAAAVDERAGRKYTLKFDKFSRYHTINDSFDYWATRLQERLFELRARNVPAGK